MRKRILFIALINTFTFPCFSQITTTSVSTPKKQEKIIVFDSTKNYLGENDVFSYKGQLLYVLPLSKSIESYGYRYFYKIDCNPLLGMNYCSGRYGERAEKSEFNTRYEDLVNKYFYVDSISKYKPVSVLDDYNYLFYLTEKKNPSNRCCYVYDPNSDFDFNFLVVSHFNYLKENFVGKKFIIAKNYIRGNDIISGDTIIIPDETKMSWTVTDVSILDDEYRNLEMIIKSGNITSCVTVTSFLDGLSPDDTRRIFEKKEWDKLVATYGYSMMKMVISAKIKVGMPKKLLIMSWGKPDRINSSSYGADQYVYGRDYVYVKGGKVTSWN